MNPNFDPNTLTGESKQIWTDLEEANRRELYLFINRRRQRAERKVAAVARGSAAGDGSSPRTSPAAPSSPRSLLLTALPGRGVGQKMAGARLLDLGVSVVSLVVIGAVAIGVVVAQRLTQPRREIR